MTARVVHVSDLHIGSHGAREPYVALQELAAQIQPDLVLATGDLTERGRSDELEPPPPSFATSGFRSSSSREITTSPTTTWRRDTHGPSPSGSACRTG